MSRLRVIGNVIEFDGYRVALVVEGAPPSVVWDFMRAVEGAISKDELKDAEEGASELGYERGRKDGWHEGRKDLHPFVREAVKAVKLLSSEVGAKV